MPDLSPRTDARPRWSAPLTGAAALLIACAGSAPEAPPAEAQPEEAPPTEEARPAEAPSCDHPELPDVAADGSHLEARGRINDETLRFSCDFDRPADPHTRLTIVSRGDGEKAGLPSYHLECYAADRNLSFWLSGVTGPGELRQRNAWSEDNNLSLDMRSGDKMLRTTSMVAPENPNLESLAAYVMTHEAGDGENRVVGCLVGAWTEDGVNSFGEVYARFALRVDVPSPVEEGEDETE